MKKLITIVTSLVLTALMNTNVFAAGDDANLQLLGQFKRTDSAMGESIPQDTKFADNVRKNIIPNIKSIYRWKDKISTDTEFLLIIKTMESVENKVNKTVKSSKSDLNEATAYVDPQIQAIKDLMRKIS